MAEQDMGMDIKINGAETAVNTVEKLAEVMGRFGGSLAVASGLLGQLEESLKAFKSIDASALKNLKEISKLNSVVANAKWTDTHEKYQRAKYDIGGANVDVEYKKWQAAKLKRDEEFANTELGKRIKTARAEAEIIPVPIIPKLIPFPTMPPPNKFPIFVSFNKFPKPRPK